MCDYCFFEITTPLEKWLYGNSRNCFRGVQRHKVKADRLVKPEEYDLYFEDLTRRANAEIEPLNTLETVPQWSSLQAQITLPSTRTLSISSRSRLIGAYRVLSLSKTRLFGCFSILLTMMVSSMPTA